MDDTAVYDRILVDAEQLEAGVAALARRICSAYQGDGDVLALVLLEGARTFADSLLPRLSFRPQVEYLKLSSYHGGTKSCGQPHLHFPPSFCEKMRDKNILIIDDIYDTGLTLHSVIAHIGPCQPKSIKTCVLLEKKIPHQKHIRIDFPGFSVEDVFVIGYGMDYQGRYRDLPFVAALHPDRIGENQT
jgi:hypoxanthine phosphoribosyltransferase